LINACQKDTSFGGGDPSITISTDTLTFDTVFTQVGSATRSFKSGGDSVYVFADVTVDPDQPLSVSPFIIEEKIKIKAGETEAELLLEAWGQNANYVPGSRRKGIVSRLSCDLGMETWDDPKPYVIYGVLFIDSCELVLPEGVDIVDSAAQVTIESSEIYNTSSAGIIGVNADITARNTLIHSNGQSCANLTYGGDYLFEHCTFASYGNQSSAVRFDNFRCTDPPLCQELVFVDRLDTRFVNCVFAGNDKDEIFPVDWTGGDEPDLFNFLFINCAVTIDEILEPNLYPNFYDNCEGCFPITVNDTLFFDLDNNEYRLDTMSIAIDRGVLVPATTTDINDDPRDAMPDVGAYEFQK